MLVHLHIRLQWEHVMSLVVSLIVTDVASFAIATNVFWSHKELVIT